MRLLNASIYTRIKAFPVLLAFCLLAPLSVVQLSVAQEVEHEGQEAAHDKHSEAHEEETGDPGAVGHSADGNYIYVPWPDSKKWQKSFELPRILLVRNAEGGIGLDVFGSTCSLLKSGKYDLIEKYDTDKAEDVLFSQTDLETLIADPHHPYLYYKVQPKGGSTLIDFSITRQILFVFLAGAVLIFMMTRLAGRYKRGIGREKAPQGVWQNMLETLIKFIRDEVAKAAIGPNYKKYVPYLLTMFFFILLGNLLGLVPWGVTATSNIMVTGALATITFIVVQFSGNKSYWSHIFWPPGVAVPIKFILIPVEILGMFTKPISLAFRLFGNMVSGHLAIVSVLGLIFVTAAKISLFVGGIFVPFSMAITIFIYLLKLLVSFIQAYIFVMLSAVFIGMAVEEHHHDDHSDAHHHADAHGSTTEGSGNGVLESMSHGSGNGSLTPAQQPQLAQ